MAEMTYGEPYPEDINRNYADSADNLRARFAVYELARPRVDVHEKAISILQKLNILTSEATVMDVGTADGSLFDVLYAKYGHRGPFIGIDPNARQFSRLAHPLFNVGTEKWLQLQNTGQPIPINPDAVINLRDHKNVQPFRITDKLTLYEGVATDLSPFRDKSVDVLFAMFMLYHIPTAERPQAYSEFKRVLKRNGVMVTATSGAANKPMHRAFEEMIADHLGIAAPPRMNANFTSEVAATELSQVFKRVYRYDHHATVDISDSYGGMVLRQSIHSLRDQFKPIPTPSEFDHALLQTVIAEFARQHREHGTAMKEYTHRSLFLSSDRPLHIPAKVGFTEISTS